MKSSIDESVISEVGEQNKNLFMTIVKIGLCVIFTVFAVMGGSILGDFVIGQFDTFDPTQFDASKYVESQMNIDNWKTKGINSLTATQVFVVAESRLHECNYYGVFTKGYNGEDKGIVTTLGMTQDLYGYRCLVDGKGYIDYYSAGLANVAKKIEYTVNENKYYCYEGKIAGDSATWTPNPTESGCLYRTAEEYKEMVGCYAENPIDYIVSTKTVTKETTNEKVGDLYSYTLILNPTTSVLNYVKRMNYMSGFGYPKFSSVELRFEVDENMNFRNIYISESYKIMGMSASSKYKNEFVYENVEVR